MKCLCLFVAIPLLLDVGGMIVAIQTLNSVHEKGYFLF